MIAIAAARGWEFSWTLDPCQFCTAGPVCIYVLSVYMHRTSQRGLVLYMLYILVNIRLCVYVLLVLVIAVKLIRSIAIVNSMDLTCSLVRIYMQMNHIGFGALNVNLVLL